MPRSPVRQQVKHVRVTGSQRMILFPLWSTNFLKRPNPTTHVPIYSGLRRQSLMSVIPLCRRSMSLIINFQMMFWVVIRHPGKTRRS